MPINKCNMPVPVPSYSISELARKSTSGLCSGCSSCPSLPAPALFFSPFFPHLRASGSSPVSVPPACPSARPWLFALLAGELSPPPWVRHRPRPSDAQRRVWPHAPRPREPGSLGVLSCSAAMPSRWDAAVGAGTEGSGAAAQSRAAGPIGTGTGKLLAGIPAAPAVPGSCIPRRWAREVLRLGATPVCTLESASNGEEKMLV